MNVSSDGPEQLSPSMQGLFERIAPIRYGSKLRFPRLVFHVLRHRRRDLGALRAGVSKLLTAQGRDVDADTLNAYLEPLLLLHYLQVCNVEVLTMLKPPLMESLARECARVIQERVPGDFVDVGIWKGGSSMIIKSIADACGGDRRVFCLDIFDTMDMRVIDDTDPLDDHLIIGALDFAREYFGTEGVHTSIPEIRQNFSKMGVSVEGVEFVQGNLIDEAFPFDRIDQIALLRIDCDFYTATRNTLARLYPKMQPGGTIIFDDYYLEGFGERRAADEFRESVGDRSPLQQVGQSAVWRLPAPS